VEQLTYLLDCTIIDSIGLTFWNDAGGMGFKSRADQISHTLPTTRHRCNRDCVGLDAKRGDGHHSLVTPPKGY